jgi:hypothetical protein
MRAGSQPGLQIKLLNELLHTYAVFAYKQLIKTVSPPRSSKFSAAAAASCVCVFSQRSLVPSTTYTSYVHAHTQSAWRKGDRESKQIILKHTHSPEKRPVSVHAVCFCNLHRLSAEF